MTSRKPPSQRDPGYALQRFQRQLQSMVPGTMGGRVANASPVNLSSDALPFLGLGSEGGGSTFTRTDFAYITGALTAGEAEMGVLSAVGTDFRVLYITTDAPARVRLYASTSDQQRDYGRPLTYDPFPGLGIIMDYLTSSELLAAPLAPPAEGATFDDALAGNVPITVTSVNGGPITVTLTILPLE